jgi:thymidylate synthase (FAD)
MTPVTPKIFFLGEPSWNRAGVEKWLLHIGGQEALSCLEHVDGSDLEKLVELLARRCYKSFAPGLNPNVTKVRTNSAEYHATIRSSREKKKRGKSKLHHG